MILYLMRHGIAERPVSGGEDYARALTGHGRDVLAKAARTLREVLAAPDILLHSPYLRARQTAEIMADAWGLSPEREVLLAPGCGMSDLQDVYELHGGPERLMTVGHQPDVGTLVQLLTGRAVSIREGTLVVIETPRLGPRAGTVQQVYDTLTLAASEQEP
ncbi:MAG TPA: histidine phosphatase family protein [Rhodothermales bacterium]|nr:histidine phosphatase family protein [Rhodothermales bacterium]